MKSGALFGLVNLHTCKQWRSLLFVGPLALGWGCGCSSSSPPRVTSIAISPSGSTIAYGASIQFSLTFEPAGATPPSIVVWTSSNSGVATINTQGLAQSPGFADLGAVGPTTITAKASGLQASTVLTVLPPPTQIRILENFPAIFIGSSDPVSFLVLNVTSPDPIAQSLVVPDYWTSSDPSVATISSSGLITPVAPGISTLTASYNSATASVVLEVWGKPARFVYVADSASNSISGFSLSVSFPFGLPLFCCGSIRSGDFVELPQAVPNSPVAAGNSPLALAADLSGKFLFAANSGSNNISVYSIDQTTGSLMTVAGSPFSTGSGPNALAIDPAGKYLYVANSQDGNISGYSIDSNAGTLTPLGGFPVATGSNPKAMAVDAGGFVYVVNGGSDSLSVFQVNAGTGALGPVTGSPFSTGHQPSAVAGYAPGNFVYVTNQSSNSISGFARDVTGNFRELTGSPFPLYTTSPPCPGDQPLGIAVDPPYPLVFVSVKQGLGHCSGVSVEMYDIDGAAGMLRNASSSPIDGDGFLGPQPAIAVDLSGRYIYVLDAGKNAMVQHVLNARMGFSLSGSGSGVAVGNTPTAVLVVK